MYPVGMDESLACQDLSRTALVPQGSSAVFLDQFFRHFLDTADPLSAGVSQLAVGWISVAVEPSLFRW